jgi:hypothetical protein
MCIGDTVMKQDAEIQYYSHTPAIMETKAHYCQLVTQLCHL